MPEFDVIILPSYAQVDDWRKANAANLEAGLFAQTVTTFGAWVSDLWELHGDGRDVVDALQREIIMMHVFSDNPPGLDSAGLAHLAALFVSKSAGVSQFAQALAAVREGSAVEGLSEQETAFLQALIRYEDALVRLGLVEPGSAAAALAAKPDEVFPRGLAVLMPDAAPLSWIQEHFFARCPQLAVTLQVSPGAQGIARCPECVGVRFAFPSGRLAQPALVADIVSEMPPGGDAVVVCKDPVAMFERVQDRLCRQGSCVRVQARKPFAQTDFGRAFMAMHRCVHGEPWDGAALTDVLLSPFSGFTSGDAFKVDAAVRADRLATRDDVFATLRIQSELFSQLEELAIDPEADVLIDVFEQLVNASTSRSAVWKAEQLSAIAALKKATAIARRLNADIGSCVSALERASIQVAAQVAGEGAPIVFTTQPIAARMQARSCDALIVADLTAEDYPVAERDDAAATLMAKLGMAPEESALSRARRQFTALCQLPRNAMVIVRPLGDDAAEATYPSVVLEEFIDAYRADPSATEDIDNAYRLPSALQESLAERGEELLFANQRAGGPELRQPIAAIVGEPSLQDVGRSVKSILPTRRDSQGNVLSRFCPSPSQLEVYLECPYQWFITRRLRVDTLDEGFGPLERGTFAHAALEAFYRRFREDGYEKVNAKNLDAAREVMRAVLSELVSRQFQEEPRSGRLVYITELERREVEALCRQLVSFLDYEAAFLPTFHPAYLEFEIEADHPAEYAGCSLVGKVDRIDVDDEGRAVIVDYKGSIGAEHEIAEKDFHHAGKVQTRVYAQVIKRVLGLDVVGALYVSYGRRPSASGAFDPRVLEGAHLPGMRLDRCACKLEEAPFDEDASFADFTFDRMLDATEGLVAEAVTRMGAGDIAPRPSHAGACTYCPVISCPKRGA